MLVVIELWIVLIVVALTILFICALLWKISHLETRIDIIWEKTQARSEQNQADILNERLRLDACDKRMYNLDIAHHTICTKVCILDNNSTALLLEGNARLNVIETEANAQLYNMLTRLDVIETEANAQLYNMLARLDVIETRCENPPVGNDFKCAFDTFQSHSSINVIETRCKKSPVDAAQPE